MKWKTGAVLMAFVFCLAILPPLVSGARAGGMGVFAGIGNDALHELVMQEGNARAMADGQELSLGDSVGAAVYRSAQGDIMAPVRGIVEAMELVMDWDNPSQTVMLAQGKTKAEIAVGSSEITGGKQAIAVSTPAVNTGGTLFIPVRALAQAFDWAYTERDEGALVMISAKTKEIKDNDAQKLGKDALALLGEPRSALVTDTLVFRAGSDAVVKHGAETDLVDDAGAYAAPMVANSQYYLPAKAAAIAFGGAAEDIKGGGAKLEIGGAVIELTADGQAALDGKKRKDTTEADVLLQEDVLYVSSDLLCAMLGYESAGEGTVCLIGTRSFANATSQVAYLAELGDALPDCRPEIPKADAYVALTFDDGPTGGASGLTARLLDGLYDRGAHATFFMCGYRIKDFHTHMARYIAEGHELGNHTMNHPGLLTKKDYTTILDQIVSNSSLIDAYCDQRPTVFRPVGGAVNEDVKKAAKQDGLPVVNWSVDTLDWKYRDAASIKKIIVNQAKDGDIVLLHDLRECTLDGALAAIDELTKKGYAFVTVSELARIKGVEMTPGEVYTNFRDSTVRQIKDGTYKAKY